MLLKELHGIGQAVWIHQQIQITPPPGCEGSGGLQAERDALDHQHRDTRPFK